MPKLLVLLFAIFGVSAALATDEWWEFEKAGEGLTAGTVNQAGQSLGQYCDYSESACYWNLLLETSCQKGFEAPALGSDGAGSVVITAHCQGRTTGPGAVTYRYLLSDFDVVDKLVRSGGIVGIAFALDSGKFQVVRFNTIGATAKLDAMRTKANARAKTATGSTTL